MSSADWLQFLISYTVQASLVIGVAAALDRWTHVADTKAKIWTACFVSILGVLAAGLLLPRLHWFHPWSHLSPSSLLVTAEVEEVVGRIFLAIWLLGLGVMIARWAIEFWRVQRFIAQCPSVSEAEVAHIQSLLPKGGVVVQGREVQFRVSPEDLGPFCYQFHSPLVFIPQSLLSGDIAELTHVLEHELAHLRTQHPLQLFLQKVVQCVLWFHPLVWISAGRAGLVREFVCDDASTHDGVSTAAYLRTLLRIVEQRSRARGGLLSIGCSVSEVRTRAERLVETHVAGSSRQSAWAIGLMLVTALVASQVWLPTNPLVSQRSSYSAWPTWSAHALHTLDLHVSDFQPFDARMQLHELREDQYELTLNQEQ